MNALVVANIDEATATSEFLKSQRELVDSIYQNDNSYLAAAQEMSDSYMQMKQRIPMVLEYYVTPEEIATVEMYINPEKLSFQHSKIISKQVTRGGIFFHHYGEDTPTMSLSGSTGMSGMRGIEQLEKIFNYSGTLLKYQNVGINKIDNGKSERRQILDYNGAVTGFDDAANSEELTALSETYDEIIESANVLIDKNSGLLSERQAMLLISKDLKLLYTEKIFSQENADVKVIAEQTIRELQSKEYHSFNEIFDIAKKYTKKSTFNNNTANSKDIIDEVAFQIAFDIYQNSYSNMTNKALANGDVANDGEIIYVNNTYCIYKCKMVSYMYSKPSYSATRLDALKVNGRFTGKKDTITDDGWIEHINGGWAKIHDSDSNNWRTNSYIKTYIYAENMFEELEHSVEFASTEVLLNKMGDYQLALLKNGGVITSDKTKEIEIRINNSNYTFTFVRHIKKHEFKNKIVYGWIPVSMINTKNNKKEYWLSKPTYLELEVIDGVTCNNVKFYTVIKDGVYLYKEPNIASGKFQEKPAIVGGKFTAIAYSGDWIKHINGGWALIKKDGVIYIKEGFSTDVETNTNTDVDEEITTNNNITTAITNIKVDAKTALQKYLTEVREWNKNSVIKRWEVESGFADIQDELTDEWRPRLVYIYFEDRVYLGHFDHFNYDRIAQTENITYNMQFTIQRMVSVTSISPNRFEQSDILEYGETFEENNEYANNLEYYKDKYAKGNDIPLKIAILRTRCIFYREKAEANRTGIPMTKERQTQLHNWAVQLRACSIYNGKQQIVESTPIFGNVGGDYDLYVRFIQLQYIVSNGSFTTPSGISTEQAVKDAQTNLQLLKRIDGQIVTVTDIQSEGNLALINDVVEPELARVVNIWNADKKSPTYTIARKREIYEHVNKLLYAVGARYSNNSNFKTLLNSWQYIRDNSLAEIGVLLVTEVLKVMVGQDRFKKLAEQLAKNNFGSVPGYVSFKASDYTRAWRANQINDFIEAGGAVQFNVPKIFKDREMMLYMTNDYYEREAKKLINYI